MIALGEAVTIAWIALAGTFVTGVLAIVQSAITRSRVAEGVAEMRPNGGATMRDAVDRIERKLDNHGERLAVLEDHICADRAAH